MSWSIKITVLYLGFVSLILTLVIICSKQKVELESMDYYIQELKYQDKMAAIANENSLEKSIEHIVTPRAIHLTIPFELVSNDFKGEVHFFCPSNSEKDMKLPLTFDNQGKMEIPRGKIQPGIYKLKLSWTSQGKNYYKENVININ
jgi:hypothetical protein